MINRRRPPDNDIPQGHEGNRFFALLEILTDNSERGLIHITGTMGKDADPEVAAATLRNRLQLTVNIPIEFHGISASAVEVFAKGIDQLADELGIISRELLMQLLEVR